MPSTEPQDRKDPSPTPFRMQQAGGVGEGEGGSLPVGAEQGAGKDSSSVSNSYKMNRNEASFMRSRS